MRVKELRAFIEKVGLEEAARRTGLSKRALSRKTLSREAKLELEAAKERSLRARRSAKTRERKKTRIPEAVSTKELAKAERVSERTVEKWKKEGGAPAGARDAAIQIQKGEKPYREPKSEGRRAKPEKSDAAKLSSAMRRFVEAVDSRAGKDAIAKAYRSFRKIKLRVRRTMTARGWAEFMGELGRKLGLPDLGTFSVERFRKS